tara:strand:+ start:3622 stop:3828 length:207 start_codon:yes stop_codon:yes gene_type:complete
MINQLGSVPSVNSVGMFGTVEVLNSFPDMPLPGLDDLAGEQRKPSWVGLPPEGLSKLVLSSDVKKVLQ